MSNKDLMRTFLKIKSELGHVFHKSDIMKGEPPKIKHDIQYIYIYIYIYEKQINFFPIHRRMFHQTLCHTLSFIITQERE